MVELRGRRDNRIYRLSERINSGGEGTIYGIVGDPNHVVKIYHNPTQAHLAKLTRMVESDLKNSPDMAYPEDLVFEGNRFRGFVMRRVKGVSFSSVYATSSKDVPVSQEVRFTIAKNLCIALLNVHEAGFVFGDFNPANIRVDVKRRTVTLMDTDAFIFDSYGGIMARPEMVPLEIRNAMRRNESLPDGKKVKLPFTRESDIFSLAVHLFRLLMNGQHPFAYKPVRQLGQRPMFAYEFDTPTFPYVDNNLGLAPPPHGVPLEAIPLELQALFVRTFREGYSDPSMRPGIRDFLEEIEQYEKSSVPCRGNCAHRYYGSLTTCPFCEADRRHSLACRNQTPATVPVSKFDYAFDLDYDFIITHPGRLDMVRKKAMAGSAPSNLILGRLHSDGILEEQSDRKAAEYFLKASMAKRPSVEAQYRLGLCFLDGIGVPQSKADAIKWLTISANLGYVPAKQIMEYVIGLEPISVSTSIDPIEPIVEDVPETPVVKPRAPRRTPQQKCIDDVVSGDRDALHRLHGFVMNDKIDWNSTPSVHDPFKEAANDSPELAFLCYEILEKIGDADSRRYLESSADAGYEPAMNRLSEILLSEIDVPDNGPSDAALTTFDDVFLLPEDYVVDEHPSIDPQPSRIRGGLNIFLDKIKGLWRRKRSP